MKPAPAKGFQAPGVVVSYTTDAGVQSSKKFLALGSQTAAGVPLQCDEPADFMTFRVGLFGLEKLHNVDPAAWQIRGRTGPDRADPRRRYGVKKGNLIRVRLPCLLSIK